MITESFDNQSPPIISREAIYGKGGHVCDTCVITFSKKIFDDAIARYHSPQIAQIRVCNGDIPVHLLEMDGKKIAFYLSGIGSTMALDHRRPKIRRLRFRRLVGQHENKRQIRHSDSRLPR